MRRPLLAILLVGLIGMGALVAPAGASPEGQMTLAQTVFQQRMHDKAMFAPLMEVASLGGYGPRVLESGMGLITNMAGSTPYEDLKLKSK